MTELLSRELEAFGDVDFEWVRQLKSVWRDPPYHAVGVHDELTAQIIADFRAKTKTFDATPVGQVIVGNAGAGKTHLIGSLRRRVWEEGGWFVLLDLAGIKDFWASAALCFVASLNQPMPNGASQYQAILSKIVAKEGFDPRIQIMLGYLIERQDIALQIERKTVDGFVRAFLESLERAFPGERAYPDIVRACLMLILGDWDARNIAYSWLQGLDLYEEDLRPLGFGRARPSQIDLVRGMSWLMGLAGPTLIGVDQIDAIVSEANLRRPGEAGEKEAASILESLARGLMELHDAKFRAMTVVSCLHATWSVLKGRATVAVTDRFRPPIELHSLRSEKAAQDIVAARLRQPYAEKNFKPPYETWPFAPAGFAATIGFTPRQLLKACDDHRRRCLEEGQVFELQSFQGAALAGKDLSLGEDFDALFEMAKRAVDLAAFFSPDDEDRPLGDLMVEALRLYAAQTATPDDVDLTIDADANKRPPLHARLTFTYHAEGDRERHYCFRALSHANANAFQCRLRASMTASGIDRALNFRHLFILRRAPPPSGDKTAKLVSEFHAGGGKIIAPADDDLRTLAALAKLSQERHEGFPAWLRARKALCESAIFKEAGLCGEAGCEAHDDHVPAKAAAPVMAAASPEPQARPAAESSPIGSEWEGGPAEMGERRIVVGRRLEGGGFGREEAIPVNLLPRHTAILAGSGSGKTVLLRRIVEEAALKRVPAIILDINNDLALLGDPWPQRPASFTEADDAKAAAFAKEVEVIVWTPGLSKGRPLCLDMLPDFSVLGDDVDERGLAVDMARATLSPLVGASTGAKANLKAGVLAKALHHFAARKGGGLEDLIALLADLPDGVSEIGKAAKLAEEMADQLRAAIDANPLLNGRGAPLDPQILFGDEGAGRTRISVINFSGLASEESRQGFVNQLQMALFTFIKRRPSATGRLYVLDEAQNFAPSQKMTACKESALSLVAQARKYGLGMIFATQAPKGIDNKIISNCTTHFYGKMNSPAAIEAARELIAAKGGAGDDIASLTSGVFYFATEGSRRPVKVRAPFCLSHHPQNPLSPEEVVARALKSREQGN